MLQRAGGAGGRRGKALRLGRVLVSVEDMILQQMKAGGLRYRYV